MIYDTNCTKANPNDKTGLLTRQAIKPTGSISPNVAGSLPASESDPGPRPGVDKVDPVLVGG